MTARMHEIITCRDHLAVFGHTEMSQGLWNAARCAVSDSEIEELRLTAGVSGRQDRFLARKAKSQNYYYD